MKLAEMLRTSQGARSAPLDGVRGLAVVVLLAYHFGVEALEGAWIGISLFFVFSGYVITTILLKEQARHGRIDYLGFYRRRARRLLPSLTLLILVVGTWAVIAADNATRRDMKGDILATAAFVQNWRLISQADQYFAEFGDPSFFRHVWTLSVEEQFYLVAPFVAMLLIRVVASRGTRVAIILGLALASAWWTAHIGVATSEAAAHAYYGTDTRVQSLLAGMAVAFAVGPDRHGRRPRLMSEWSAGWWAWAATLTSIVGFFVVPPLAPAMFERGGLLALSVLTAMGLAGAVQSGPGAFRRIFSWGPLVYLGILTYGLYLWHWPVALWLERYAPDLPWAAEFLFGSAITLAVAAISFHVVELPIMLGGLSRLTGSVRRGRFLAVGATLLVLTTAVVVGRVPTVEQDVAAGRVPQLVEGTPRYEPGTERLRVALYGDSVPHYLADRFPDSTYSDIDLIDLSVEGCSLLPLTTYWSPDYREEVKEPCRRSREQLVDDLQAQEADVLTLMVGTDLGTLHERADGSLVEPGSDELRGLVEEQLEELRSAAESAGVSQVQLVTLPCREVSVDRLPSPPFDPEWMAEHPEITRNLADPIVTNGWLKNWAARTSTPVLDLYSAMRCEEGFQRRVHGITLFQDALHFSEEATPMVWTWLAPSIRERWQTRA